MFFGRRNKPSQDTEHLYKEILKLQKAILENQGKTIEYHFHFDKVDIHDPKLEQLSFQLEHLDIEDLSGALNLGNNFGVHVKPSYKEKPKLEKTRDGLKFTFKEKEE
ncbi:hypothetical protein [Halobacillus sp. B29]|uniref:hypothetical protein n=1 Tax=Halobacillus sp. B29 TaxID=3457432 RepID=UPI003FCC9DED